MWNIGSRNPSLFRTSVEIGRRHYAPMSKKKFAVNLRYKDGRQLALEYFDFYYKPIFGRGWPSIRLGLTSRTKTCAVVNSFGCNSSTIINQFEYSGAVELVPLLKKSNERRANTINKKDQKIVSVEQEQVEREDVAAEPEEEANLAECRSAATLNEFVAPTKLITRDTVPQWQEDDGGLATTPWSPKKIQVIPSEDVVYPEHLRVFVYPLGDITKFIDASLEEISSVRSYQIIDAAALFPVLALDIRPDERVLDLCAAPGEKTLALLQTLIPCNLACNDVSLAQVNLLRHNICNYVQRKEDVSGRLVFMRVDSTNLPEKHIGVYDKVLVDVPNTEDRKSLRLSDTEGNLFRRAMMETRLRLPDLQTEILVGGLKAVKRDGYLVYTTATLSPSQNDEVVETALRRLQQDPENETEFVVCDLEPLARDFSYANVLRFARRQCRYGQLIVPFLPNNYGPVYACKLKRVD